MAPVTRHRLPDGRKRWPCWLLVLLLSACFRSVPVDAVKPELNLPEETVAADAVEPAYFEEEIEEQIVDAVVMGEDSGEIKAKFRVEGRFTQAEQLEILALIAGVQRQKGPEAYWVVLQDNQQDWEIAGVANPVSGEFLEDGEGNAAGAYWMPPQILDFDHDGIQEAFIPLREEQGGWNWDTIHVYRFDGIEWGKMDWSMIVSQDNTDVPTGDLELPYRYTYQVKWSLEDGDHDQVDEIVIDEMVTYYGFDKGEVRDVLGKRQRERVFRWTGDVFEPDPRTTVVSQLDALVPSVFFPWWDEDKLPDMVLVEYPEGGPAILHFAMQGQGEKALLVTGWEESDTFQVVRESVYFPGGKVDQSGVKTIPCPALPGTVSAAVSPDGMKLAWLFVSELEDLNAAEEKWTHAALLVSDQDGNEPDMVWTVEQKDAMVYYRLLGWSLDGRQIYVGQGGYPEQGPWRGSPGLLAIDLETGKATPLGQRVNVVETALSPDEIWLAQVEQLGQMDQFGLRLLFRSRAGQTVWQIEALQNAVRVGNFSFSPDGEVVVWREWVWKDLEERIVIRGMSLADGVPWEIYQTILLPGEKIDQAGVIQGWIDEKRFVLVSEAGKGESYLFSLENGEKEPLSPYSFLAVVK